MSLLRIPTELLLAIKDNFECDLLAHVAYLQLCTRTRACYDGAPLAFWRKLVRENGLGLARFELEEETSDYWQAVAEECAEHAWECTHPGCGQRRLEENRTELQRVKEYWPGWAGNEAVKTQQFTGSGPPEVFPSSVFRHIGFNNRFPSPLDNEAERGEEMLWCAFLRHVPARRWEGADALRLHPIAVRSFATFPPLSKMALLTPRIYTIEGAVGDDFLVAENVAGVTTHDLITTFSEILGRSMTCHELHDLICYPPNIIPSTWTHSDLLCAAGKVGTRFQLMNWDGFGVLPFENNNVLFHCELSRKTLPSDAETHIAMYNYIVP